MTERFVVNGKLDHVDGAGADDVADGGGRPADEREDDDEVRAVVVQQFEACKARSSDDAGTGDDDRQPLGVVEQFHHFAHPEAGNDLAGLFEIESYFAHPVGQLGGAIDHDDAGTGTGDEAWLGVRRHSSGSFRRS